MEQINFVYHLVGYIENTATPQIFLPITHNQNLMKTHLENPIRKTFYEAIIFEHVKI